MAGAKARYVVALAAVVLRGLSAAVLRLQSDHKAVPVAASRSKRVTFSADFRSTARSARSTKMWFLTDEKATAPAERCQLEFGREGCG
ncbi:hypothetical protein EV645_5808 [Kribbella rubisoli]|uniref:Uncharacterized protein n=1 Tax=Kribbella rubisoli TaxID=3075929 RepID=A0A4V2FX70_9ACTN|nr:hypothetical protein [Kribbella rubisoli]RZU12536.1 hypothetical protein EV645_5808 [Kribbella rubisoli]